MDSRRTHPRYVVAYPVRFTLAGRPTAAATTRDVSLAGAFLRTPSPPEAGLDCLLSLELPDGEAPLSLSARVVRSVPRPRPGDPAGFAVAFGPLSPPARQRLEKNLTAEPGGLERRAGTRFSARYNLRLSTRRDFLAEYTDNISRGGLFIVTDRPAQPSELITVVLELPDGEPPLDVAATVVHVGAGGMGCQFVAQTESFRRRLQGCLDKLAAPAKS